MIVKMLDNNNKELQKGDSVNHRHKDYPTGTIEKIEDGCNSLCWVDFKQEILGNKHLTICCKSDVVKTDLKINLYESQNNLVLSER